MTYGVAFQEIEALFFQLFENAIKPPVTKAEIDALKKEIAQMNLPNLSWTLRPLRIDIITSCFLHPVAIFQYIHLKINIWTHEKTNTEFL